MTDQFETQVDTQVEATEAVATEQVEGTEQVEATAETASHVTIAALNPTKEEMAELRDRIKSNYDFDVNVIETKFNFKKSKDKDTGIETIREAVVLAMPYPSVDGIVTILENGGLGLELLLDSMNDVVNAAARTLLYDDINLNASTFPVDKVSWDFISKIPKVQRRGGGIPKEIWEAFAEDYLSVMPDVTGKTIDQVANAAKCLSAKLVTVKTNKPVLKLLVEQLAIYVDNSESAEEYQECVAFLVNKADMFLNVSDEDLLANL